ncbi:MAG: alpha/beta fold hydrolase, partial [Planctomycetes bacterium]|nr:alpha/beta fold hydrolase [Planctomycetota bacterium]
VYFYGNGETVAASTARLVTLSRRLDCRIVAIDYPGYGFSEGAPAFETILAVAEGAYELAAGQAEAGQDVFVYGRSIGTAPAVHVAARFPVAALILEAPPTSAAEIIPEFAKILPPPLRWFIRMRADEALENRSPQPVEEIRQVRAPLLIIHGRRDRVIPIRFGRRMYEQAATPAALKHFVEVPLAGHNNLDPTDEAILAPLRRFVESRGRAIQSMQSTQPMQ